MAKIKLIRKIKKNERERFWPSFFLGFVPVLILYLIFAGSLVASKTMAILRDDQSSMGSIIQAGILDFSITPPSSFSSAPIQKGESVGINISLLNGGNLNFQYTASTTIIGGDQDLCAALDLEASLNSVVIYNGNVSEFANPPQNYTAPSDWNLSITLPDTAVDSLQNKSCNLRFSFNGWQNGLTSDEGFNNLEFLDVIINSGQWTGLPEPGDANMSPISDSYIRQDRATTNYGGNTTMLLQSRSGSRNYRAIIRFNFNFPSGVTIDSSYLKLYMTSAPGASRNYEARSLLSGWTETGITWDNQPTSSSSPTDTVTTGTISNVWVSWNVKNDVQSIVNGAANYGWLIKDAVENSSAARSATFASRENTTSAIRPVLEVVFSAPPASTDHPVVNEVYYQVATDKGVETTDEWVEVYNPTASDINLLGWKLCDNNGCDTLGSYTLPSRGFAVIVPSTSNFDTYWTLPSDAIKVTLPNANIGGNGLSNTGDRVYIQNASSVIVDGMSYGTDVSQFNPSVAVGRLGSSFARIIKGYDFNIADDWIINSTPNPGTNPGSDGKEVMRFTDYGIEVAASSVGLQPLKSVYIPPDPLIEESDEIVIETFGQCMAGGTAPAQEPTEETIPVATSNIIENVAEEIFASTTDAATEDEPLNISSTTPTTELSSTTNKTIEALTGAVEVQAPVAIETEKIEIVQEVQAPEVSAPFDESATSPMSSTETSSPDNTTATQSQ